MIATTTRPADHHNDDVVLVPFAPEHLEGALQLSQEMSWPYRLEDWAFALELGQGFVLRNSAGTVIATAAWWAYGEDDASCGMIIVSKAAQGRGHGARLMDALLAAAHPRTITLNSTAEGLALYERRGFVRTGVIQQHQGVPHERHQALPASLVRVMAPSDVEAVAHLDRKATGWARRQMLDRLVQAGDGHVLVRDGEPRGYVISRLFGRGHVIGPVVAESAADARVLIEAALARLGQVFVRVDTADTSQLGEWLESIGLRQVGDATTMVKGPHIPPAGPARMFALANQSFN
ncbi:GNAT family N-acetyltransferase [Variovorax sp. J22G21]|uniref:GNAT family N-acetyltransferase n=1 Tax=Variovorax fucosicus TaxID=3053517 RepID=UPI002578F8BE|nr:MULTISPECIES: GNAT family N-acetyltransferase [unclassified Variovorax]MDM0041176.1 GNAT family N-acetyltransferase [Variovorax sp. J22R193]MDM0060233.1 GNAT family N-acetyltransferase [Variovorax sp. J22G21]